jgi:hypothetical protein
MNTPTKLTVIAVALALAAWAGLALLPGDGRGLAVQAGAAPDANAMPGAQPGAAAMAATGAGASPGVALTNGAALTANPGATPTTSPTAAGTVGATGPLAGVAAGGSGLSTKSWPTPPLSLRLGDAPPVQIGERPWAVLGTQVLDRGDVKTAVLVLRDESSGQLDYRQSALRFTLAAGGDYEAYIAQIPGAKRVFANALYGEVVLEPADIAAAYSRLKADGRVATVVFSPLPALVNKK